MALQSRTPWLARDYCTERQPFLLFLWNQALSPAFFLTDISASALKFGSPAPTSTLFEDMTTSFHQLSSCLVEGRLLRTLGRRVWEVLMPTVHDESTVPLLSTNLLSPLMSTLSKNYLSSQRIHCKPSWSPGCCLTATQMTLLPHAQCCTLNPESLVSAFY